MFDPHHVGPYRQNYYYQRKGQVLRKRITNSAKTYTIAELKKLVPLMYLNGLIPKPKPKPEEEEEEEEDQPEPPPPEQVLATGISVALRNSSGTVEGATVYSKFADFTKNFVREIRLIINTYYKPSYNSSIKK